MYCFYFRYTYSRQNGLLVKFILINLIKLYFLLDHPSHKPNPSVPLNESEQFHCMFKANFDNHSLLYGAELDGISSQQPITDTFIGKTFELIELKTFPLHNTINGNIYGRISPNRLSEWWSQSYLGEINRIICGLKDGTSTVRMIKEYSMHDLPNLSKVNNSI